MTDQEIVDIKFPEPSPPPPPPSNIAPPGPWNATDLALVVFALGLIIWVILK